jgi:hypothetical protein
MEIRKFAILRYTWLGEDLGQQTTWSDNAYRALFDDANISWSLARYWMTYTIGLLKPQYELFPWRKFRTARNNDRNGTIQAAIAQAAADSDFRASNYKGVVVVVHPPPCNAGGVKGSTNLLLDQNGFHEFFAHEVGHSLGFEHAFGPAGAYNDDYCLMGFTNPQSHQITPTPPFSTTSGLHPQFWQGGRMPSGATLYRYLPSFASSACITRVGRTAAGDHELTALSETKLIEPAVLLCDAPPGELLVEYRTNSHMDRGVAPALVIHSLGRQPIPAGASEVRPTYLERVVPSPFLERAFWQDANLCVEVLGLSAYGKKAKVRISRPFPLPPGRHSGNLIQSSFGVGNYEMVACLAGNVVAHFWRENGRRDFPWHSGHRFVLGARSEGPLGLMRSTPVSANLIRAAMRAEGAGERFELLVRVNFAQLPDGSGDKLLQSAFDTRSGRWAPLEDVRAAGALIQGATGEPAMIQSDFGRNGNFEMLVPQGHVLRHFWRNNDAADRTWHAGASLALERGGDNDARRVIYDPVGVCLLNSSFKGNGAQGNFDAVVRLRPRMALDGPADALYFCAFDTGRSNWTPLTPVVADGAPIRGVTGDPVMIQGSYGENGNYELLVPIGTKLCHFWRDNQAPNFAWHAGSQIEFAGSAQGDARPAVAWPVRASMVQSNIAGDGMTGNFDVVVQVRRTRPGMSVDDQLEFLSFDTATRRWTSPKQIVADGAPIVGVVGF